MVAPSQQPGYDGNESYTPAVYIEAAREVMGSIDYDPCSCREANGVVRAQYYRDKTGQWRLFSGEPLHTEISGKVWLNPPYGRGLKPRFVGELLHSAFWEAIVLLDVAPQTKTQQRLLQDHGAWACFPDHRISFWKPGGEVLKDNRYSSVFYYLGSNPQRFAEVFSRFGAVMRPAEAA